MVRISKKAKLLALYEVSWWQAHHRRQKGKLLRFMAKLYQAQFGISYRQALVAVGKRVEAAGWHDQAEAAEDAGRKKEADLLWKKAKFCLQEHFQLLQEAR